MVDANYPEFNADTYLQLNPDVAQAGLDALEHFLQVGFREGRLCVEPVLPAPDTGVEIPYDFDPDIYLLRNPDVFQSGVDATEHYREFGFEEGRPYLPEPNPDPVIAIPADFNAETYLLLNPDIARSGVDATDHYREFGFQEGRPYLMDTSSRLGLTTKALERGMALEIGPFCNPVLIGEKVCYFDILDRTALLARAEAIGYPVIRVPEIDYVSPIGDLSIIDRTFDSVLSAHCIEHQPDLIRHLNAVSALLDDSGGYFLIIPDTRYCFDAGLDPSNLAEVIAAHVEGRRVHALASVIEHRALFTHNEPSRHWQGDSFDKDYDDTVLQRVKGAVDAWQQSGGDYIDVHAWQFTPTSFRRLITQLRALDYIDFVVEELNDPLPGSNEFTAILRKG